VFISKSFLISFFCFCYRFQELFKAKLGFLGNEEKDSYVVAFLLTVNISWIGFSLIVLKLINVMKFVGPSQENVFLLKIVFLFL